MFKLLDKEYVGTIELGSKVRVSDPCYDVDTWCAGTLENVKPGKYVCTKQRTDMGNWGVRIAAIEVRHEDHQDVEPLEIQNIDVGVDSGQCGIYDFDYFAENRKDKDDEDKWYDRVCDSTEEYIQNPNYVPFNESSFWKAEYEKIEFIINLLETKMDSLKAAFINIKSGLDKTEDLTEEERVYLEEKKELQKDLSWELELEYYRAKEKYRQSKESSERIFRFAANTLDNKCLVSSAGDGDGSYVCCVGRDQMGQVVSIQIDFYFRYDVEEEDEE